MVGVAGKSKGCATCRKRKIKCDETKPVCKRCERSRLQCDRYERFPVFIDRGQTGYRKRVPLEEVKPYAQPQHILSPEVESVRLIAWFREGYVESLPSQYALQIRTHWLCLVGTQQSPHPALKAALLAMSFARWSKIESNPGLKQNATGHYQQSLKLTQKALLRAEDALSDDILATACIMTLYELSNPSYLNSDSWLDHISGIGNLICLRGPKDFASVESRAMFEHMRYIFMVRCLITRTSCVFGSLQWRQLPWDGVPKPVEQQVFDQGLRLTSVCKDCDSLLSASADAHRPLQVDVLLSTCIDIFSILDPLVDQISLDALRTDTSSAVKAATLLLNTTALGVQLSAASSAHKLLTFSNATIPGSYPLILNTAFETIIQAQALSQARRNLARRILWSVEARMKMFAVELGTLRMAWSLGLAVEQFTAADSEAEQCKAMLTLLTQRTGPFDALRMPLGRHANSPVYRSF